MSEMRRTPQVMGILNLTPDSFSDGGRYRGRAAVRRAYEMIDEGADILDIGGESTRPGSERITSDEELNRIKDVLKEIVPSVSVPVSMDTMHPEVAAFAIDTGVDMINDVSGLSDEKMIDVVISSGVRAVIMHTPEGGIHESMQGDVVPQISNFFTRRCSYLLDRGLKKDRIILDPGIGFGKNDEQNVRITGSLDELKMGYPLLVGTSRKRFLRTAYPDLDRDTASLMSAEYCMKKGADIVRVHDVRGTKALHENKSYDCRYSDQNCK